MKAMTAALVAALFVSIAAAPAAADFGLSEFDVRFTEADGTEARQAGAHPFAMTTSFLVNSTETAPEEFFVDGGDIKNLFVEQLKGFVGSAAAVQRCDLVDFASVVASVPACGEETVVGVTAAMLLSPTRGALPAPVYNLEPPPGVPARLGFVTGGVPLVIDVGVKDVRDHNIVAKVRNIPQPLTVFGSVLQLWGVPADPRHDFARGKCVASAFPEDPAEIVLDGELNLIEGGPTCPAGAPEEAFLTLPRACDGPLATGFELDPWNDPGAWVRGSHATAAFAGCGKLRFAPDIASRATTDSAESASGLDFELSFEDPGLTSPVGTAGSEMKQVVVALPQGMTVNPSVGEGLGACTPEDLRRETLAAAPGQGCPSSSKIGTVAVRTPLLEQAIEGSVFLAEQDDPDTAAPENPFDSDIAIYIVLKNRDLGILVKQAGKVEPDPRTGQLVSTFPDVPQVPFSHLRFRFREGQRAPLITPPTCGTHTTTALFTPWARPNEKVEKSASFQITRGVGGGPCPPGGALPFEPGFEAGTQSNAAGSYSPFHMRLTRRDGDQDLTRFDAVLPPGVTAKLAGVPWCPDVAIARARSRDGKDELARPSCPPASQIGAVRGGAGVGSQLTYVPGKVYLAGPVGGAPISVVGIVPAVAGPFDVGTIVVRQALALDPITGQARVVSAASDDLPHILAGIPLKVRDIQVSVHRPSFTLNPTNCNPMAVLAGIWGGGSDVFSAHDDLPVLRQARFQAASCASLGFKPKLAIKLRGGVKRGAHPALRAHVRPRPGDANFSRAVVTLPTSAFLDQAHIRTICTRVQFAAGAGHGSACPPGARYGFARAWSPLLDGPVTGPVYLRSSDNNLPDLVAALTGPPSAQVQVELAARIDSVKGGIRSTFAGIPDLPVSRFILDMQGGKKGLIVNSRHLCHKPKRNRARANLRGQNGKINRTRPRVIATKCQKRRKAKRKQAKRAARRFVRVSRASRAG